MTAEAPITYDPAPGRLVRLRVRCGKLTADTHGRLFQPSEKCPGEWYVEFPNVRILGCGCACHTGERPHFQRLSPDWFDVVRG